MARSTGASRRPPFAQALRRYREALGLTQAELARRLKVPDDYISKWERGKWRPRPKRITQMCKLAHDRQAILACLDLENAAELAGYTLD